LFAVPPLLKLSSMELDGGGPNSSTGAFFVPSVASPFTMHTLG